VDNLYIKNMDNLLVSDNNKLREIGLKIVNHSLLFADPYSATKKMINLDGKILRVNNYKIDLSKKGNIYVFGGGKAAYKVAKALEEILQDKIVEGLIILKEGYKGSLKTVKIRRASHPIPNNAGFEAVKEIRQLISKLSEEDIVFWINTGGISALAPFPVKEISLDDKRYINQLLLSCGANIAEINTVRTHLSEIKGGKLALEILPAEIVNLIVSDNPGDPINVGPTGLDYTTFSDAISILKQYGLWKNFPERAKKYLLNPPPEMENPKTFGRFQEKVHSFILVNNRMACQGALVKAREEGFNSMLISTLIEGESKEVAKVHAAIGKEIIISGQPIRPPACIVSGGETVVTVKGNGIGGSNLEFALAAAIEIQDIDDILIISLGTDGTDGPTDAAGAIVDGNTVRKAKRIGIEPKDFLRRNDSYNFFRLINDLIITGHTGTNVMDIRIVLVK